jgi:Putative transposase.
MHCLAWTSNKHHKHRKIWLPFATQLVKLEFPPTGALRASKSAPGGFVSAPCRLQAIIDSVFSTPGTGVQFHKARRLLDEDIAAVQTGVRARVLHLFERRGLLESDAAAEMRKFRHGGSFSLNAEARDRAGLKRLLRYCARPIFTFIC